MITSISLKNFAAFKKLELEFTSGINIIIGENSCGKTQILKSIYALSSDQDITSKLLGLFKPHSGKLSGLYHRGGEGKAKVLIEDSSEQFSSAEFGPRMKDAKKDSSIVNTGQPVLLPTKEVLSLLPAIQAGEVTDKALASLFDDSIIDLCHLLLSQPDADISDAVNEDPRLGQIIPMLVKAIGGRFEINGDDHAFVKGSFVEKVNPNISKGQSAKIYADFKQLKFEKEKSSETSVTMTAEGYRKIGLLQCLIDTGALVKGKTNVLLWDEPESNINPALMKLLVECLFELARNGQQVIIASHNYVMLKWFDLLMDKSQGDHVSYHALFRDINDDIAKQTMDNYKMLSKNAIAQTYSDLYDAELERSLGVAHD
jgi:energy-coupling factor transporter ATP-binding protein EcfA2